MAKNNKEVSNVSPNSVVTQNHSGTDETKVVNSDANNLSDKDAQEKIQEALDKRLLEQISGGQIHEGPEKSQNPPSATDGKNNTVPGISGMGDQCQGKFQRCIAEGDLDFVSIG